MTEAASLVVAVGGRDVGAEALIQKVMALLRQADQTGTRAGQGIGTNFSAGVGRATNGALAFQAAQARLEAQQGNLTGSANRLRNALAQQNATTTQTIAIQRQLLTVETQLATGQSGLARAFSEAGSAAKSNLLGMLGPAAAVGVAFNTARAVVQSFVDAFNFKAQLDATTASINAQLKGVRDTNQVYAEAAAFGREFKLTQEEQTQAIAASIGVMRSSKAPIEDILGVLARMQVLSPEQSLQEAAVALKALSSGDTTSLVTRFEVGRDVATQMKNEIQGGADAVAVMSKFLGDTGIGMDTLAARATGAAGKIKDAAIAAEELKLAQAAFAEGPGLAILQTQIDVTRGATRLLTGDFEAMGQSILNFINAVGTAVPQIGAATTAQDEGARSAGDWSFAISTATSSMATQIDTAIAASTAYRNQTQTLQESANASILDAAAKQEQTDVTALLAAQTQRTVDEFLRLNPNISASSAASAAAAAGYSPLIARLIELAARSRDARGELAALNALAGVQAQAQADFRAGERSGGQARTTAEEARLAAAHANTARAARESALAEAQYQQQLGNSGPLLKLRQAELAKLTKGSAAYFDKLREINQIESAGAKKVRGGGGAGAARLSDQAKLNNSLLSDQEKYQDQAEAAATAHEQKLLDIEREFAERSLAQQRQNEVGKRDSRASFYRTLLIDTEGISPQIQASLSAAYEAAFAKSQELAQQGNQAQADAYLDLKQQQLNAETQFQSDLAKARADGDKDLIKRLEAVRALERQAEAEKERQILEGGDANVSARDKALTEEEQRYAEQQGRMATASDAATERKIANAEREGKKIDELNLKHQRQVDLLGQTGGAPGTSTGVPAPTASPTSTPVAPTAAPADVGAVLAGLLGKLDEVRTAVDAVRRATEQGADKVARATAQRAVN